MAALVNFRDETQAQTLDNTTKEYKLNLESDEMISLSN
jgi:hypothetical protein